MRCLHVIEAMDDRPSTHALLELLEAAAGEARVGDVHDVAALEGGALESALRALARRVTVCEGRLGLIAAFTSGAYDVAHLLDARPAHILAPAVVAMSTATLVTHAAAVETGARPAAAQALLASADLVVTDLRVSLDDLRSVTPLTSERAA